MSSIHRYTDLIEQEARILRVSRMIPDDGPLDFSAASQVLALARDYMKEYGVTRAQLAAAIGTSESYVSTLFSESDSAKLFKPDSQLPARTRDKLVRDVNRWLDVDFRSRVGKRPDNFVLTSAAELIVGAAQHIRAMGTIGIVDGPAGVGKTLTAEYIGASILPGTMNVFVDHDCVSATGLLKKVYAACRLRRQANTVARLEHVIERLRGTGRLLIIDQAHDLRGGRCFRLLMNLHDQAGIPIMLLGTKDIHNQTRDDQDPEYGQMSSRIGYRMHLTGHLFRRGKGGRPVQWISVEELRKIFQRKLRFDSDAWKALASIANFEVGYLRLTRNIVTLAEAFARAEKSDLVTLAHVEAAVERVQGEARPVAIDRDTTHAQEATA